MSERRRQTVELGCRNQRGIAVIFTSRAEATPMTLPIPIPVRISQYVSMSESRKVKKTAIAIPIAAITFPERAVGGELRRRMPTMRRTAATRYVKLIAVCDSASGAVIGA